MTAPCNGYQENWDLLALGAVDPDLQEEMNVHLRNCTACQRSFCESRAVVDAISTVAPDDFVAVGTKLPRHIPGRSNLIPWLLAAACTAGIVWIAHDQYEIAYLRAEMDRRLDSGREVSENRRVFEMLESNSMRQLELRGADPAVSGVTARAIWSPQGGLLFVARNLPDLPDEKCYQLWVIRKQNPSVLSGGVVSKDRGGRGRLFSAMSGSLEQVTGFAITDEPKGGSVVARGRKLMVGIQ